MQLGDGLIHVEERTLFSYFADDLQQKGGRKRGSKLPGCPQASLLSFFDSQAGHWHIPPTPAHKALSIPSEDRCHHALGSHSAALRLWVTPSVWIWGDPSSCALPSHTIGGSVMPVTVQISCTREP